MNRFSWRSTPWAYGILGWIMMIPMGISLNPPSWLVAQSWFIPFVMPLATLASLCLEAFFAMIGIIGGVLSLRRPGSRVRGTVSIGISLPLLVLLGLAFWVVSKGGI